MSIKYINVGSSPNDNTGTTIRGGGQLLNNNFAVLLNALSYDGNTVSINTTSTPSNVFVTSTFAQNTVTITLIEDRLQVANAAATYSTITRSNEVEENALAFSITFG